MDLLWVSCHPRGLEAPLGQLAGGLLSLAWLLGSPSAAVPRCVEEPDTFHRNAVGFIRTRFEVVQIH